MHSRLMHIIAKFSDNYDDYEEIIDNDHEITDGINDKVDAVEYSPKIALGVPSVKILGISGFNVRASTEGVNNEPIINEILKLRNEEASLLGFPHFAALSLSHKMGDTLESANKLIQAIFEAAMPVAKREFEELTLFAKNQLELNLQIKPWAVQYLTEELLGVRVQEVDQEKEGFTTWHEDVKVHKMVDNRSEEKKAMHGWVFVLPEARISKQAKYDYQ
ncbi:9474_t:CDS:2 [Ambispora leptoticha]|uniref:9474_t:CDS:1 n=1 Tax=Ambispora leptoticha TaxID=144679 RepID=A0A9N9DPA4_9GLOM|nr:9474_t:CDS:2 [Ambispora leptoticha]